MPHTPNPETAPIAAIQAAFTQPKPAFMPYFTLGYPTLAASIDIIQACAESGADLMELGIPFSDPLADGPTIQHSTQVALENGTTVAKCLEAVKELRARGVTIPFMLMGYINPILAYGIKAFVQTAAAYGANGFIIPDLPPEEAGEFHAACVNHSMGLSFLLAPNSPIDRIQVVAEKTRGFIYLVSVTGITGSRDQLPPDLTAFIQRVRPFTQTPLAVGFGISTPEQTQAVGAIADGVIVGSALIRTVETAHKNNSNPIQAASRFVKSLAESLA